MSAVYYLRHRKVKPFPNFDDKPEKSEVVKLQPKRRKRARIRSITRAKTLTEEQFLVCVAEARKRPHTERNIAILHLSFYAGLRAQEIAGLRWKRNILGADHKIADNLHVTRDIGKRTQERYIPIRAPLRKALQDLLDLEGTRGVYVIQPLYERSNHSERASEEPRKVHPNTLAQWCSRFFDLVGYNGCTSHSGRRTFITGLARRCNLEQTSILDVQKLAGHANITTTMSYIEESPHRDKLVERVFQ